MRDKREAFTRLPRSCRLCVIEGILGDAWWRETFARLPRSCRLRVFEGILDRCVVGKRRLHVYHVHVVYEFSRAS